MSDIKVNFVVFSLDAYNKVGIESMLGYVIESPQPNIVPMKIPGPFSFYVNIMLVGIEENESYDFKFIIKNKVEKIYDSGEITISGSDEISITYIPKEFKPRFLNFKLHNVHFENEGEYEYSILVNGKEVKSDKFGVFQVPAHGDSDE